MSYYLAAVGGGELIGFDAVFDRIAKVDDIRQTARVATVGADRDVTVINHDIAGHPIRGIRCRSCELRGVFAEKNEQIAASAEVDIRIRIFALSEICGVTGVNIGIDHILEGIPRSLECLPDNVVQTP